MAPRPCKKQYDQIVKHFDKFIVSSGILKKFGNRETSCISLCIRCANTHGASVSLAPQFRLRT